MSVQKKSQSDDGLDRSSLFIKSLPYSVDSEKLSDFFSQLAPIKHAVVVTDPKTGESKGFGFVKLASPDDVTKVLETARKSKIEGRHINIDIAKRRRRQIPKTESEAGNSNQQQQAKEDEEQKRRPELIIRNMPWSVRDTDELAKIFGKYGKVLNARIPRGKGGKMTGYAFVTMRKQAQAEKAVAESVGLKIGGREVAVDFSVDPKKWKAQAPQITVDEAEEVSDDENTSSEGEDSSDQEQLDNEGDLDETSSQDDDYEDVSDGESSIEEDDDVDSSVSHINTKKLRPSKEKDLGTTIFVRNVPYDATQETLKEHFSQFGRVKYALPVYDHILQQPKGTAFVCFSDKKTCEECVSNAPIVQSSSLLVSEATRPEYIFEGRTLAVTLAVDKNSAQKLADAGIKKRQKLLGKVVKESDKRNVFLLNEGRIEPGSKLAENMDKTETIIREQSYNLRRQQLAKNPSLHLSLTRLAIRNLPRSMDSKALKALARKAVVSFAEEVKAGSRQPLSSEEVKRSRESDKQKFSKKKRGVVKQAKIVYEQKAAGEGRSRGYGFIEFSSHRWALMGLRYLNGHLVTAEEVRQLSTTDSSSSSGSSKPSDAGKKLEVLPSDGGSSSKGPSGGAGKRLVVEFAIENAQVLKRRQEKTDKARHQSQSEKYQQHKDTIGPSSSSGGEGKSRKRSLDEASSTTSAGVEDDKRLGKIIANKRRAKKRKLKG